MKTGVWLWNFFVGEKAQFVVVVFVLSEILLKFFAFQGIRTDSEAEQILLLYIRELS